MKKNNLFKIIIIFILFFMVLSFIIPATNLDDGKIVNDGYFTFSIVSFFSSITNFFSNFYYTDEFSNYSTNIVPYFTILFSILLTGSFYTVLNNTLGYNNLIKKIVDRFNNKPKQFIIITVLFFSILSSLFGFIPLLILFVPFFITVLLKLGMNKYTCMASTILSIIIGIIGSTYSSTVTGSVVRYFYSGPNDNIFVRLILLFVIIAFTLIYIFKRINVKSDTKDVLYEENKKTNRSFKPLLIVIGIFSVLVIVLTYNLYYMFNIDFISGLTNKLNNITIFNYKIFSNTIGNLTNFGYYSYYNYSIMLLIVIFIIGKIYNISFKNCLGYIVKGFKRMVPICCYIILSSVITVMLFNNSSNFINTINYKLISISSSNIFITGLVTFISSLFYNNFIMLTSYLSNILSFNYLLICSLVLQSIYGFVSIFVPSSVLLIFGLSYLNISYKEWIKYIFKYLLVLLVILIIIFTFIFLFI